MDFYRICNKGLHWGRKSVSDYQQGTKELLDGIASNLRVPALTSICR